MPNAKRLPYLDFFLVRFQNISSLKRLSGGP